MPDTFDELTGTARASDKDSASKSEGPVESDALTNSFPPEDDGPARGMDESRTPIKVREVAKELTCYGLIEAARKPNLYRMVQNHQQILAATTCVVRRAGSDTLAGGGRAYKR